MNYNVDLEKALDLMMKSPNLIVVHGDGKSFHIPSGGQVRFPDGTTMEVVEWMRVSGFMDATTVGSFRVIYQPPADYDGFCSQERFLFFLAGCCELPFDSPPLNLRDVR